MVCGREQAVKQRLAILIVLKVVLLLLVNAVLVVS